MATLYANRMPENKSEQETIRHLQQHLPDDYVLVANVMIADDGRVPEIDLVVLKDNAIITVEVKGWYGAIKGNPVADFVKLGNREQIARNPIHQADKQAKTLATYLRQPENTTRIFGDPRIGLSLYVIPVVIFSNPDADIQIESHANVKLLRLEESVAYLTDPDLRGRNCLITPVERERLAQLLLNEPLDLAAVPAADIIQLPAPTVEEPEEATNSNPLPRIVHQPTPVTEQPVTEPTMHRSGDSWFRNLFGWATGLPEHAEQKVEWVEARIAGQKRGCISNGQLARAVEKEMEQTLNYLLRDTIARNHYVVGLAMTDFDQYLPLRERLEEELTHYLQQIITSRDYKTLGPLQVEVIEMTALAPGECQVRSYIRKSGAVAGGVTAYLELAGSGQRYALGKMLYRLGRAKNNDICLGDLDQQRLISRQHAEIRQENGQFVLYDLNSSRGTYANGQRLNGRGHVLRDGDSFILGPTQRGDLNRPVAGSLMFTFHA